MSLGQTLVRLVRIRSAVSVRARAHHALKMLIQNYMSGRPLSTGMQDPHFKGRFVDVPAIVNDWCGNSRIRGADILDFGCGEGISALGLLQAFGARRVVGIDIMPDPNRCLDVAKAHLGIEALPPALELYRVQPGELHNDADRFDVVYSWSVFEHVDQTLVDQSLSLIRSILRPGGLFLEVSHLSHVLKEPWIHLRKQQNLLKYEVWKAAPDPVEAAALWSTYCTLNKITHQELVTRIAANGFEILRTYLTRHELEPPPALLDVYHRDALLTNQVVVLARAG